MARPQEVTNLHILGFLNDRTSDITKLGELLHDQKSESTVGVSCNKKSLKRKLSMISIKKRTSSYMRYKLPRVISKKKKKGKLSTPGRQREPRCRRERRNRCLLRDLHCIHTLEANEFSLKDDQKALPRWLETHFWNRKRFVTKLCWGYCLPTRHKARGKRFVQSALKDSAVIHDSSYIRPIQIVGYSRNIHQLLRQITVSLSCANSPFQNIYCKQLLNPFMSVED
jgi:Ribonucleases P/MRP protein subunit POP1